ncbi:MAG TPA: N-acetyl-gamma-glutamyl-phosphate reductase [Myxococcota bacterium]
MNAKRIGIVGARGHVGRELLKLLENDPTCTVAFVASKGAARQRASEAIGAVGRFADLVLEDVQPADLVAGAKYGDLDGVVLGLSNGQSAPWVQAVPAHIPLVDLSADHRFVDDGPFVYGLTERDRERVRSAKRIANPGCYATAVQLAVVPFLDVATRVHVFGISGYSGAGSTPSPKNDLQILADNVLPYDLAGHTQERELARHSGVVDMRFMPHVAPFFRGISCTIHIDLSSALDVDTALSRLRARFATEPLVTVVDGDMPPLVSDVRDRNGVVIGGVEVDVVNKRLVLVSVIDNLLKGAATQALQNLHLMLGVDELSGITP